MENWLIKVASRFIPVKIVLPSKFDLNSLSQELAVTKCPNTLSMAFLDCTYFELNCKQSVGL